MGYSLALQRGLDLLASLLCLAALAYASYLDVRYREVEPAYWYAWLRILAPLGFMEAYINYESWPIHGGPRSFLVLVLATNLAAVGIAYGAYLAGLLGGGDVLAVLLVSMAEPIVPHLLLPPSMLSLLYGSLAALLTTLYPCFVNIYKNRGLLRRLAERHGLPTMVRACFTAYPLTVREALMRAWLFPAPWELGGYSIVEADPPELLAQLAEERGLDGIVWVTPGIPQILFITLGFIASLLLGDEPLKALLLHIKA